MRFVALILWAATACAGIYLLVSWVASGGVRRQPAKVTRYPFLVLACHPLLAVAGLVLWIAFLLGGGAGPAWGAFGVLCASALLGFTLLTRWLTGRGGRHARGETGHFPLWPALVHGTAGLATFVLVLITATIMSHR